MKPLFHQPVDDGPFVESDLKLLAALSEVVAGQLYNQGIIQSLQAANAGLETSREQLLHSRNVLRAMFDSFPDGIYIIDRDYHLTAVNMQRARRIGRHPTALVGRVCYQALYNRESPCSECRVWGTIYYGESTEQNRRGKSLEGEIQEWELHSYPIRDSQERVVQAILLEQDITDTRRLELTLAQSEKLAAVGQWAASLAHEINNPLTDIIANAQLLEREIPEGDDLRELVDLISRAGECANQVVRNLLDLARKDEYLFGSTDVNQTIERSLSLLQHEFAARAVSLVLEPAESLPPTLVAMDKTLQAVGLSLIDRVGSQQYAIAYTAALILTALWTTVAWFLNRDSLERFFSSPAPQVTHSVSASVDEDTGETESRNRVWLGLTWNILEPEWRIRSTRPLVEWPYRNSWSDQAIHRFTRMRGILE